MPTRRDNAADPSSTPSAGDDPYRNWQVAADQVLTVLVDRVGLDLGLVTQVRAGLQTVLVCRTGSSMRLPQEESFLEPAGDVSHGRTARGLEGQVQAGTAVPWQHSPCRLMVQGQAPRAVGRVADVAGLHEAVTHLSLPVGAYVGVPLLDRDGRLFGTLCGFGSSEHAEVVVELPVVETLARLLSSLMVVEHDVAAERRENGRLRVLADHDPLTGLLNRRGWDQTVQVAQEASRTTRTASTVVTVDMDGLKRVNDSAGHSAGDRALIAVADALRLAARPGDARARLGGDEFALLARGLDDAAEAARLADRVARACAQRGVPVSTGVAVGGLAESLVEVCRDADAHMYAARAARRHPHRRGTLDRRDLA